MNPTETAVAKNGDDVAGQRVFHDPGDDGLDIREIPSAASEASDVGREFYRIEAVVFRDFVEIWDGGDDGKIRCSE